MDHKPTYNRNKYNYLGLLLPLCIDYYGLLAGVWDWLPRENRASGLSNSSSDWVGHSGPQDQTTRWEFCECFPATSGAVARRLRIRAPPRRDLPRDCRVGAATLRWTRLPEQRQPGCGRSCSCSGHTLGCCRPALLPGEVPPGPPRPRLRRTPLWAGCRYPPGAVEEPISGRMQLPLHFAAPGRRGAPLRSD